MEKIRWGILGTGSIAHTYAGDIPHAPHAKLCAVGSRTEEKAAAFAAEFGLSRAYGSYEALVNSPEIDAVYIATPHSRHCKDALLALQAGKHVLCEKAFCINAREAREMIETAKEKGLYLCEAMWPRFHPAADQVRTWLGEGRIGRVTHVTAEYGFAIDFASHNPRLFEPSCGGGSLLDLGVYPIALASFAFGGEAPKRIASAGVKLPNGVDGAVSMALGYDGGTASLSCSFFASQEARAVIYGEKGCITLSPRYLNPELVVLHENGQPPVTVKTPFAGSGREFTIEAASLDILAGRTESSQIPLSETLSTMETMDAIRRQIGVVYENDR